MTSKKSVVKKSASTKKSVSSEDGDKKKHDQGTVFLIVTVIAITIILVGWNFLFPPHQVQDPKTYNNYVFTETQDGFWYVNVEIAQRPYKIIFRYHPKELEDIVVAKGMVAQLARFANRQRAGDSVELFITMNPEDITPQYGMAGVEIAKVTGEKFDIMNIPTHTAVTSVYDGLNELTPIKTCADADDDTLIIWIKEGEKAGVDSPTPNCIIVKGTSPNETIKVADRFMYESLGIM